MQEQQFPLVSVLMPVRNEAGFIARSLGAVLAQDYPRERLEIIVADGCSTDGTREIIEGLQAQHERLRVLDNPGRIVPTGMNAALRAAGGEIIVRVDGHCEVAPDYVRCCVEELQRSGVAGVGGPLETIGATFTARAIALAMSSPFGVGGAAFRTVKERALLVETIAFPAYTRQTIERAGPYDEELVRNQDDEYNYRLRKLGGRLLLSPRIRARYYSRSSLRALWRQYFQYGYWKVRVLQKHPRQMRARQFAPPLFVLALLLSVLTALLTNWGGRLLAALLAAYALATTLAAVMTARRAGWRFALLLPVVFATLHLAYGAGFLTGLLKFWRRWGAQQEQAFVEQDGVLFHKRSS